MRIKLMIVMAVVIVALAAACHLLWRRAWAVAEERDDYAAAAKAYSAAMDDASDGERVFRCRRRMTGSLPPWTRCAAR